MALPREQDALVTLCSLFEDQARVTYTKQSQTHTKMQYVAFTRT